MSSSKGLVSPTLEESKSISQQPAKEVSENSLNTFKQSDIKLNSKQETEDVKKSNPSKIALCNLKQSYNLYNECFIVNNYMSIILVEGL